MNLGPTRPPCGDTVIQYQPLPSHSRLLIFILQRSTPCSLNPGAFLPHGPQPRPPLAPAVHRHMPRCVSKHIIRRRLALLCSEAFILAVSHTASPLAGSHPNSDVKADFARPSTSAGSRHEDDLLSLQRTTPDLWSALCKWRPYLRALRSLGFASQIRECNLIYGFEFLPGTLPATATSPQGPASSSLVSPHPFPLSPFPLSPPLSLWRALLPFPSTDTCLRLIG